MPTFRFAPERSAALLLVLVLHGLVFWGLWQARNPPDPAASPPLIFSLIAPPEPAPPEIPRPPPRPPARLPVAPPPPQRPAVEAPATEIVAPVVPAPIVDAPPPAATVAPAAPKTALPTRLDTELAVTCPHRPPPPYPALSRRRGEAGSLVVRVELDENGRIANAIVESSSGFERLDQAALATVTAWRCDPPRRRVQARQTFTFILEGN